MEKGRKSRESFPVLFRTYVFSVLWKGWTLLVLQPSCDLSLIMRLSSKNRNNTFQTWLLKIEGNLKILLLSLSRDHRDTNPTLVLYRSQFSAESKLEFRLQFWIACIIYNFFHKWLQIDILQITFQTTTQSYPDHIRDHIIIWTTVKSRLHSVQSISI